MSDESIKKGRIAEKSDGLFLFSDSTPGLPLGRLMRGVVATGKKSN